MKAHKFQDLQLASWRPRKREDVSSNPKTGGLKKWEELIFQFKSERRKQLLSSSKAGRQEESPLAHRSVSSIQVYN